MDKIDVREVEALLGPLLTELRRAKPSLSPLALDATSISVLRWLAKARRLQRKAIPCALICDPVFEILLALALSRIDGHQVSIKQICITAGVPTTTALRYLQLLTGQGYVSRRADQRDRRRVFIDITDRAFGEIMAYAEALATLQ